MKKTPQRNGALRKLLVKVIGFETTFGCKLSRRADGPNPGSSRRDSPYLNDKTWESAFTGGETQAHREEFKAKIRGIEF
jgi:hypothetical protein